MSLFRTKELTVKRPQGITNNKGVLEETSEETFNIVGSVQVDAPDTMERQTEGRESKRGYVIYTDTPLKTSDEGSNGADKVVYDGKEYEVTNVSNWNNGLINHIKVKVMEL